MAKGIQIMAGDIECGSPLAIFCIPTHFVGDTLSGATPAVNRFKSGVPPQPQKVL